jgi:hypothetical protein
MSSLEKNSILLFFFLLGLGADSGSTASTITQTSAPSSHSSFIEAGIGSLNVEENRAIDVMPTKSSTPKRPRKNYSPMKTRSKSRRS